MNIDFVYKWKRTGEERERERERKREKKKVSREQGNIESRQME